MNSSVLSARQPPGFTSPYAGHHFMMPKLAPSLQATGELRHAPAFAALDSM